MSTNSQHTRRECLGLAIGASVSLLSPVSAAGNASVPFVQGVRQSEATQITRLVEDFRQEFGLPGVSLAMSYQGKLKLVACVGYANQEAGLSVTPSHLFRWASVSKPITSVAVLRLMEQGKISLSDVVFGEHAPLRRFSADLGEGEQAIRLRRVTVRNLLEHQCGGWSNRSGETPMFAPEALGLSHDDLIRWTLRHRPLRHEPGSKYVYSNFGYCLLGRVIEAVTGLSYRDAVQELVWKPVGVRSAWIGHRQREQRRPQEVLYYDRHNPYGPNMDVARMDAHGGWIATPTALLRFVRRVDGFSFPADILQPQTVAVMTQPSRGDYALGWRVNASRNWWHTGSFNGTSSIVARIHDGHAWAAVANSRSPADGYAAALDQLPWQVKKVVGQWGSHDLFG